MDVRFKIELDTDETGKITKIALPTDEVTQSQTFSDGRIHFGVKGRPQPTTLGRTMEARHKVEFETDSNGNPTRIIIPEEMLEHSSQTADDILEHFGVKGMKWGVRRRGGASGGPSGPTRKESRQNAKVIKKASKESRNKEIDSARKKIDKGYENFGKAKKAYKTNKKTMGKSAARQVLNAERSKLQITEIKNVDMASQLKSGRETTNAVLFSVGAIAAAGIIGGLEASRS